MICRPLPSKVDQWILPRERPRRSAGWHVSTVLVAMLQGMGVRRYTGWGQRADPRQPSDEVGYMWEDAMAAPLVQRLLVPEGCLLLPSAELELDHIFGTPDRPMFDVRRRRFVNEEAKATWMSCGSVVEFQPATDGPGGAFVPLDTFRADPKFAYWRLQTMTYAAMLHQCSLPFEWFKPLGDGTGEWTAHSYKATTWEPPLGRIRALFLNGRYKGEFAIPLGWELEWTADELTTWWASVVRFAAAHPELRTPEE